MCLTKWEERNSLIDSAWNLLFFLLSFLNFNLIYFWIRHSIHWWKSITIKANGTFCFEHKLISTIHSLIDKNLIWKDFYKKMWQKDWMIEFKSDLTIFWYFKNASDIQQFCNLISNFFFKVLNFFKTSKFQFNGSHQRVLLMKKVLFFQTMGIFIEIRWAKFHMTNKSLQLFELRRLTRRERLNLRNDERNNFVRLEKRLMQRSFESLSAPDKLDFFGVAGWLADDWLLS